MRLLLTLLCARKPKTNAPCADGLSIPFFAFTLSLSRAWASRNTKALDRRLWVRRTSGPAEPKPSNSAPAQDIERGISGRDARADVPASDAKGGKDKDVASISEIEFAVPQSPRTAVARTRPVQSVVRAHAATAARRLIPAGSQTRARSPSSPAHVDAELATAVDALPIPAAPSAPAYVEDPASARTQAPPGRMLRLSSSAQQQQ